MRRPFRAATACLLLVLLLLVSCVLSDTGVGTNIADVREKWLAFRQNPGRISCAEFKGELDGYTARKLMGYPELYEQSLQATAVLKALLASSLGESPFSCDSDKVDECMMTLLSGEARALEKANSLYFRYFVVLTWGIVLVIAISVLLLARSFSGREIALKSSSELFSHTLRTQEAERRRISRELHDGVTQDLRSIALLSAELGRGNEAFSSVSDRLNDCIKEIRSLCYSLAPEAMDGKTLPASLAQLCAKVKEDSGMEVLLTVSGEEELRLLDDERAMNIYRIIQESVQNARLHAHCGEITVMLRPGKIAVSDDGCGMDESVLSFLNGSGGTGRLSFAERGHFGTRNIRERAKMLGGSARWVSEKGEGTNLFITFPMQKTEVKDE